MAWPNTDANTDTNSDAYTDADANPNADSNPGADGYGQWIYYQGAERQRDRRSNGNAAGPVGKPNDIDEWKRKLLVLRRRNRLYLHGYPVAQPMDLYTDFPVDSCEW